MAKTDISRRSVLDLGVVAAVSVALPAAAPLDNAAGPQPGDGLVAVADAGHALLRPEAILLGAAPVLAWPVDRKSGLVRDGARFNLVLLLRVADMAAAEAGKLVAFSAICTHAGCQVSDWQAPLLHCPCHGSAFDPARDGLVVGGPAPTPLPALPVAIQDGVVVITGPFSARPGGHASRTM
jgi:rieske iron-sulfur protein